MPDNWDESAERAVAPMSRVTLAGWLGMIVCWWHDDPDMVWDAHRAVGLIPHLLAGRTEHFTAEDWWLLYDALGHFDARDEVVQEMFEIASAGWKGELPPGPTRQFDELLRSEIDERWEGNGHAAAD